MIITSEASKQLIMLELTVPWEERIKEANERKCAEDQELVQGKGLGDILCVHRSGMKGLCRSITLQSPRPARCGWASQEEGHPGYE